MAEIIELRRGETGLDDQIFNADCEMEGDLRAIDGFADALAPLVSNGRPFKPSVAPVKARLRGLLFSVRSSTRC